MSEKNTILTFIAKSLYFILTFVVGVIVARATGPEGKGVYSLVILTASIASILVGLGLPIANACFAGKKPTQIGSLVANSLFWLIVPLVLLGIVFAVLWLTVGAVSSQYVGIAFAITPFLLLISLFAELLHGMNKIPEFNLILIAVPFSQLVILFLLLRKLNLSLTLMSWAISHIIGIGLASFILLRHTNISRVNLSLLKETLIFGLQVWLTQLIGTLNLKFDTYLVAYYLGAKDVGYYSVAVTLSGFLFYIPSSIATVALPRFTSADAKSASQIACQGLRVGFFSDIILLILLFGIGKFIVPLLYGQEFARAINPLFILLPGIAIYGMAHITTAYFNGYLYRPIINTGLAILSLVVDIGLNILLIPRLGVSGAALSCTISYSLAMVVCIYIFTKLSGSSLKDIILLKPSDIRDYLRLIKWSSQ